MDSSWENSLQTDLSTLRGEGRHPLEARSRQWAVPTPQVPVVRERGMSEVFHQAGCEYSGQLRAVGLWRLFYLCEISLLTQPEMVTHHRRGIPFQLLTFPLHLHFVLHHILTSSTVSLLMAGKQWHFHETPLFLSHLLISKCRTEIQSYNITADRKVDLSLHPNPFPWLYNPALSLEPTSPYCELSCQKHFK